MALYGFSVWIICVMSLNLRVASLNLRVMGSNPQVVITNPRVRRLKAQVGDQKSPLKQ